MFFNNLVVYKFKSEDAHNYNKEKLEEALSECVFRHTTEQEISAMGWAKPFGKHGDCLVEFTGDYALLCVKQENKILPASVVNEMVAEKVEAIELEDGRVVRKREKDDIKENILMTILPQAFKKTSLLYGFIDMAKGYLIINSGSFGSAEEFAALLRKSIGTLPIVPAFANIDLDVHLTSWLANGELPQGFAIGSNAELEEPDDTNAQVKLKGHDLTCEEVLAHLESGKRVTKLALNWRSRIGFTLSNDGSIKQVGFSETIKEENADIPKEDMKVKLEADLLLGASELSQFLSELLAIGDSNDA